ncbi:MAG: hypothetical protein AAGA62_05970 [Bacteroidota bacterium]
MELHLKIIGALLIPLAMIHVIFPRYFDWKNNLRSLSLINRQMMQTHTFFIALTVFGIGWLCLSAPAELVSTALGQKLCLGLAIFWGIRFFFQLFVYSSKLWWGKPFETVVHIVFTCFWLYMTVVFGLLSG